jgi:tRNA threonylcarbamoyladenosine biosynthesis protein TsaE
MSDIFWEDVGVIEVGQVEDWTIVAQRLLQLRSKKQVVFFEGELGVGKTELIKSIISVMGGRHISSPSFAIHNQYNIGEEVVDHLDLYRLESEDEIESSGFWDLFQNSNGFILVEWPSRLDSEIPFNWHVLKVEITIGANNHRAVKITKREIDHP